MELERGRHVEIVADLGEWVLDHPLNERLREQQMIALHRAGRPAEALAAYQECRRLFDDELGVEPGPSLRRTGAAERGPGRRRTARALVQWSAAGVADHRRAARRRPQWTLRTLVGRLADERRRLGDLAAFAVSYAELENSLAARTFRLLALVDGPDLSVASAVALVDAPVEDVLVELAGAHLVEEPEPGRYRLHDLLRLFACERCRAEESSVERTKALRRLHEHLLTELDGGMGCSQRDHAVRGERVG